MDTGLIAKRYATALADFAVANGEEQQVYDEVQHLITVYQTELSFRDALLSSVLPASLKEALLRQVLGNEVSSTSGRFVSQVLHHCRERYLYFMLCSYLSLYKRRHGIHEAVLTTAAPVSDEAAERIADVVRRRTHSSEVRLHREVNESLIGGFVFRMDDQLLNASLSRQLDLLRRNLGRKQKNRIV